MKENLSPLPKISLAKLYNLCNNIAFAERFTFFRIFELWIVGMRVRLCQGTHRSTKPLMCKLNSGRDTLVLF